MFTSTTVVEIENRLTWQRSRAIVNRPRCELMRMLYECLVVEDPETKEAVYRDTDPQGVSFAEIFVRLRPDASICIVIYRTGQVARGARMVPLSRLASEVLHERLCGALDEGELL